MGTPEPPPPSSTDATVAALIATSAAGLAPLVGGALQPWVQAALGRGQARLVHQFLEEVAATLRRHEQRIGHVELDAFLSRPSTAAALNTTLGLAAKTSSREKHRLLANALVNGAAATDDTFHPLFWSLVEHHSPLDVRVLGYLSDPLNLAIRAGCTFGSEVVQGECLFAVLPELRFGQIVYREDGIVELVPDGDEDDEDDEDHDAPEHDPDAPPSPYFLFWHAMRRLFDDRLLDTGDRSFDEYIDEYETTILMVGDDHPGPNGRYPGKPFESLTALGARYLAFLTGPPAGDDAGHAARAPDQ